MAIYVLLLQFLFIICCESCGFVFPISGGRSVLFILNSATCLLIHQLFAIAQNFNIKQVISSCTRPGNTLQGCHNLEKPGKTWKSDHFWTYSGKLGETRGNLKKIGRSQGNSGNNYPVIKK